MHVTHLLKQLRVTEGILREKLFENDQEWQKAYLKYSSIRVIEREADNGSKGTYGTDSDAVPDGVSEQ